MRDSLNRIKNRMSSLLDLWKECEKKKNFEFKNSKIESGNRWSRASSRISTKLIINREISSLFDNYCKNESYGVSLHVDIGRKS